LVRQEKVIFILEFRQAAFLEQIRNVDVNTTFWGSMLQYGKLRIQTAATHGSISFDFVPNPNSIRLTIMEQQNMRQQHFQASSKMVIQNILEDRLGLRLRMPGRVRQDAPSSQAFTAITWQDRLRSALDLDQYLQRQEADRIIWRKHWMILLGKAITPLSLFIGVLLLVLGQQLLPPAIRDFTATFDLLWVLLGLFALVWLSWYIADWRNDTYEIDAKQIADVEKKPLFFSEQRRTALLGEIENIEVSIPSPIHFFFNFGNVRMQTAAAEGDFTFDWVPNPRGVAEEVRRRIEIFRQQQEMNRARQRAQELPDWFEMYNRLNPDIYRA
jgi:uncharacterized membrane protein YdbT with pleckstrin-like domain